MKVGHMVQRYDQSKPDGWPEGVEMSHANRRIWTRKARAKRYEVAAHCSACNEPGLREWVEIRADPKAIYHYKYCVRCIDALAKSARSIKRVSR